MNNIHHFWKRLRKYERVSLVITIASVITMVVLGILRICNLISLKMEIIIGLMALLMAAQTAQQWRKNRKPAIYCLLTSVVLVVFGVFVYFAM